MRLAIILSGLLIANAINPEATVNLLPMLFVTTIGLFIMDSIEFYQKIFKK